MKRTTNKMIASILCLTMLASITSFAQEETVVTNENINPYVQEITEEVEIGGTAYSYEYDIQDGKKVTNITNEDTSETDVLVYDEKTGVFFLNGNIVAEVEEVKSEDMNTEEQSGTDLFEDNGANMQAKASGYKYIGAINKKVTWKHGVAVAAVAAVIAAVLVDMTGAMVMAKMGYNAVKTFAKDCLGGRVRSKIYEMKAGKVTNYKHIWSFTTNKGTKYGNYTSYVSV